MAFSLPEIQASPRIDRRIGLIDADVVAYWASYGCDDIGKAAALRKTKDRITMICDQIQTDEIRCYLTGPKNFRNDVARYQQYKGNRYDKDGNRIKPQPKFLGVCRDYITKNYNTTPSVNEEADDLLGIAQSKCNVASGWHSIISSVDKDLKIIPGLHHDMNSGIIMEFTDPLGAIEVDAKGKVRGYGLKFFYAQLLMGDSTDWIPGLPKVTQYMKDGYPEIKRLGSCGPKTAYHVVKDCSTEEELLRRVLGCYAAYWNGDRWYKDWRSGEVVYPTPEEALTEQGQLLWIRQREGELWQIPSFGG